MNDKVRGTILEKIALSTLRRCEQSRSLAREGALPAAPPSFLNAFQASVPHIIAEIKRKSPSAGDLAPGADPVMVAGEYLAAGASAISVLTEPEYFNGSLEFLASVRAAHPASFLLMKDFILEESQIEDGLRFGANAILLIASLLEPKTLKALFGFATSLGLTSLVEVHDEEELEQAVELGAQLIGVNNRNLRTMAVSLDVSRKLAGLAPKHVTLVAESGIRTGAEVRELSDLGYRAFLVGTALMSDPKLSPGEALKALRKEARCE